MKEMRLKVERKWNALQNVINDYQKQRNAMIDAKREHKKDKVKVDALNAKIKQYDAEIADMRYRSLGLEKEFDKLSKRMGFIRLKNYVLAEAMYDNLISYQEFIKNECVTDDKEITDTIQQTIDLVKKLPFECGDSDNDRFREVYNAIADAFIEKQNIILEGIFDQVMIELEKDEESKIRK